jgi:hypothetical protein
LATAVTVPEDETVATDAADVVHDTLAPLIVALFWSLTVAESCCVAPIDEKLKLVGERAIDVATGVGVVGGPVGEGLPPSPQDRSSSAAITLPYRIRQRLAVGDPAAIASNYRGAKHSCIVSAEIGLTCFILPSQARM